MCRPALLAPRGIFASVLLGPKVGRSYYLAPFFNFPRNERFEQRTPRRRLHLRWVDRALFIWLYRRYPRILDALSIVRPETVVRWHRKGFTGYWRWKSRSPGGRPRIAKEVRDFHWPL